MSRSRQNLSIINQVYITTLHIIYHNTFNNVWVPEYEFQNFQWYFGIFIVYIHIWNTLNANLNSIMYPGRWSMFCLKYHLRGNNSCYIDILLVLCNFTKFSNKATCVTCYKRDLTTLTAPCIIHITINSCKIKQTVHFENWTSMFWTFISLNFDIYVMRGIRVIYV